MNGFLDSSGGTPSNLQQHAFPTPSTSPSAFNSDTSHTHAFHNTSMQRHGTASPPPFIGTSPPAPIRTLGFPSEPRSISLPISNSSLSSAQSYYTKGWNTSTKSSSVTAEMPPKRPAAFDPRLLLNPKAAKKRVREEDTEGSHAHPSSNKHSEINAGTNGTSNTSNTHAADFGMASRMEKLHGVIDREHHPRKRQKQTFESEDPEQKKSVFSGGSKGGIIGQHIKDLQEEGRKEAAKVSSSVVDLTAGDDDDEVIIVKDNSDREVCYGMISGKVQAHICPAPKLSARSLDPNFWPQVDLELRRRPGVNTLIISALDSRGTDFGSVDVNTSRGLAPILDRNFGVRLQAWMPFRRRREGEVIGSQISTFFDLRFNMYGPRSLAKDIGRFLGQKNIWLAPPIMTPPGTEILNPHYGKKPPVPPRSVLPGYANGSSSYTTRTTEEIRNDVQGMFDSLQTSEKLPEVEADPRIITPLLSHQKQGLYFMRKKETESILGDDDNSSTLWKTKVTTNGRKVYYNVITSKEERSKPPEVRGGILADMMGLGKTLSILSLIVGSLGEAEAWSKKKPSQHPERRPLLLLNSKCTLLVAPLSTLANWEEQIKAHILPDTLSVYVYHGSNRTRNAKALAEYDIVLTTYNIVGSEWQKLTKYGTHSPLEQTNWFRIVLDEAHMIREQSTRSSQAICTLEANRRWSVTGTPVQNRLEDLGAQMKFLRITPFNEKVGFTQHILSPFKNADPGILMRLRLLVDSFTLRRLKDRIDLPKRLDQIVRLGFSDKEREIYDWFAKDSENRMRIVAGEKKKSLGGKSYVHVLRAILRLRLICAHGQDLLGEDDLKLLNGFCKSNAIDLEEEADSRPALGQKQVFDMFNLMKETDADKCASCDRAIGPSEAFAEEAADGKDEPKDETIGYMTPCYHLLCRDCIKGYEAQLGLSAQDTHATCPLCDSLIRNAIFEITQKMVDEDEKARELARINPKLHKKVVNYTGPHTKTKALVECLRESRDESMLLYKEPPIKSVVFSGWTSHLDLIQIALDNEKIPWVRLDGTMTRAARNSALDQFRTNPDVCVILISIAAGGLGLNLTTANKVYVMEPQFNPAAEAQAIDRVHRLGQKREVTTTRFIMDGSFEEKMLELQRKKQNLADLSMSKGKLDKDEAAKKKLEELRSLFK